VTSLNALLALLVGGFLLGGYFLRQRRRDRFQARLGTAPPPRSERGRGDPGEEWGRSAVALTEAVGLARFGGLYGPLLRRAGVTSPWAGFLYSGAKLLAMAGVLPAWTLLSDPGSWLQPGRIGLFAGSILATFLLPDAFLWGQVLERRMKLQHGLPGWLDLHTTLVEAGLGFDAALARIAMETASSKEPIYKELGIVHREILLGSDRVSALRRMAARIRVEEIDQVVSSLAHADRLGAGIVIALRPQADMIRNRIWEEARTKAEKLGTKLLFPIFMGSLPLFFVLIMLPLVLRLVSGLKGILR